MHPSKKLSLKATQDWKRKRKTGECCTFSWSMVHFISVASKKINSTIERSPPLKKFPNIQNFVFLCSLDLVLPLSVLNVVSCDLYACNLNFVCCGISKMK